MGWRVVPHNALSLSCALTQRTYKGKAKPGEGGESHIVSNTFLSYYMVNVTRLLRAALAIRDLRANPKP